MLNLIKTNYKNLQIDFVINRFKLYFSNNNLNGIIISNQKQNQPNSHKTPQNDYQENSD